MALIVQKLKMKLPEGDFDDEIEEIVENLFYIPVSRNWPKHGGIMKQLVRASSLNNKDVVNVLYWEASLKKVEKKSTWLVGFMKLWTKVIMI